VAPGYCPPPLRGAAPAISHRRFAAPLRERASVFLRRYQWTAVLEPAVVAIRFAAPLFTFSSGVLGLAFVLLMLWLRRSSVRASAVRIWDVAIPDSDTRGAGLADGSAL
jgi:hypothetical protein